MSVPFLNDRHKNLSDRESGFGAVHLSKSVVI